MKNIDHLEEISARYAALIVDVWGVLCDGERAFPEACAALRAFRRHGHVVLLSNTARSADGLAEFLTQLGIDRTVYDDLVSAGDLCRTALIERAQGKAVFHLGLPEELEPFADLPVAFVGRVEEADVVLCTGLSDGGTDQMQDIALLRRIVPSRLPLFCANPDVTVLVGNRTVLCAGHLAQHYAQLGGPVFYFGKPHPPAYDAAIHAFEQIGLSLEAREILAIGDSIATDIAGARHFGLDALLVGADPSLVQYSAHQATFHIRLLR